MCSSSCLLQRFPSKPLQTNTPKKHLPLPPPPPGEKNPKENCGNCSKYRALYAKLSWHSELGRTATELCFWRDEANFRIQFSKGNAMFVSCQLLLQIRTRQEKKNEQGWKRWSGWLFASRAEGRRKAVLLTEALVCLVLVTPESRWANLTPAERDLTHTHTSKCLYK